MNIYIIKNFVVTFLFLNVLFSGTLYFSKSIEEVSETDTDLIGLEIKDSYSIGYHHNVWEKRKVKFKADLGFEIFTQRF